MHYLVDTNGWIGFLNGDPKFGESAKVLMIEQSDQCFVSVASVWEAAIKIALGKLVLPYDIEHDLPQIFEASGFSTIGIGFADAVSVRNLPKLHGDPFDRIMVAQAKIRSWQVISSDPVFDAYGIKRIW